MNVRPLMITISPPSVVLEKEAILDFYGRGKVDLKHQENERVRDYLKYKCHFTNYIFEFSIVESVSKSRIIQPQLQFLPQAASRS
ncbi:hypothetical protein M9Y10_010827 [Tritrichomonas musculus]|uniref:Uncharacterized protein n=1 Tax=Tritrichomonas musculus TaxID=1915356 RepID=A0ABR2ILZ3_9EUKA